MWLIEVHSESSTACSMYLAGVIMKVGFMVYEDNEYLDSIIY